MKPLATIILILCYSISFSQSKFPSYQEIIQTFFKKYDFNEKQFQYTIVFSKEKEGYFVEDIIKKKKELFWSADKNKYLPVHYTNGLNNDETTIINLYLTPWKNNQYDIQPYFGYENWSKDAIDYFNTKSNLNDNEEFAFGRANSEMASNLLWNNQGYADSSLMFKTSEYEGNQLNTAQLQEYRKYRHAAINSYKNVCKRNPNYNTIVGTICTKYHNEFLTSFMELRVFQNEEEATKELRDSLYSPFHIAMAKNYLQSCDSNAIVFTYGDNDTYPLMYVQAYEKFRQDILIINTSLIHTNHYINHLRRQKILQADSISLALTPKSYAGTNLELVYFDESNNSSNYVPFSNLLDSLEHKKVEKSKLGIPYFETNKFKIITNSEQTINFTIDRAYIYKGELIMLDIIQSHIATRPIYFLADDDWFLKKSIITHGIAYSLQKNTSIDNDDQPQITVDSKFTFDFLTKSISHLPGYNESLQSHRVTFYSYQNAYNTLAEHFANKGQVDSCKILFESYLKYFPLQNWNLNQYSISMIGSAFTLGLDSIGIQFIKNLLSSISNTLSNKKISYYETENFKYTLSYLLLYCPTSNPELQKEIKRLIERLKD